MVLHLLSSLIEAAWSCVYKPPYACLVDGGGRTAALATSLPIDITHWDIISLVLFNILAVILIVLDLALIFVRFLSSLPLRLLLLPLVCVFLSRS